MDIYRIDHVRQVVPDLDAARRVFEGLLGFRLAQAWEDETEGLRGLHYEIPGTTNTGWELVMPLRSGSALSAFLDGPRGPGLDRIAIEVTDLDKALADLRMQEVRIQAYNDCAGWADVEFGPATGMDGLTCRVFAPGMAHAQRRSGKIALPKPLPDDRPTIGLGGLLHVCQTHPNRLAVARWYERVAGMREIFRTPDEAWPDMATLMLSVPGSQIIWEVIAPEGEDSHVQRFLDRKGAGFHHVTFSVRDWAAAQQACDQHEIPTFGLNEGKTDGGRWRDHFIHPKHTGGVLIQLYWEEYPGIWARSDKIPVPR
jgi:methylmalonyl-CoA/ethylmalonyl-CoA epimerase